MIKFGGCPFRVGDTVTHDAWGGETAKVIGVAPMVYHPKMPRPDTVEFVVHVDRSFPIYEGAEHTDDRWMAAGLRKVG